MSNEQPVYLTEDGLQKVKEELEYLTTTRRPEIAKMISEAIKEGDLSENAGYDEAKTAQGFLEGRIRELENILKRVQIIKEGEAATNIVSMGRTVIVREAGTNFDETYTIVGSLEADPLNGRISNESPIGKALMGRKVGAKVVANTPGGEITFKIIRIE
ncbi:MAG: transcription elongation factor GreA [Caldilinea sp. CFX5]|nr:transcription elongation factor GreA [Caldilinea sp. CFX5]